MSIGADVYILFPNFLGHSTPWSSWDDCIQ